MFSVARRATTQIPRTFVQQVRTHYSDMPSTPENNAITKVLMGITGLYLGVKALKESEITGHLEHKEIKTADSWAERIQEESASSLQR